MKVEPGVYDLGTGTLRMKPFMDVEGSGEQVTKIRPAGPAGADHNTLTGASNAGLRFLTVENTGGGDYATAIRDLLQHQGQALRAGASEPPRM